MQDRHDAPEGEPTTSSEGAANLGSAQWLTDPEVVARQKAKRDRRYNLYTVPGLRFAAWMVIGVLVGVHEWLLDRDGPLDGVYMAGVAASYCLVSWLVLKRWYGRTGRLHLGDLFLWMDFGLGAYAVVLTGAEQGLLLALPMLRAADQVSTSFRRCLHFVHMGVATSAVAMLIAAQIEARPVSWNLGLGQLVLLYGAGLYITTTAKTAERIRSRLASAIRAARDAAQSEEQRAAELAQALEEAERAERTRSEFVSNISHEIRTPLAGVLGATDLALEQTSDQEVADLLRTSRTSAQNLLTLLNDLLDLSKLDADRFRLEPVEFELEERLAGFLRGMRPAAIDKGLRFDVVLDGRLPERFHTDPTRLGQVINNLVGNAIKFTERGYVRFEAHVVGDQLEFVVEDSGCGIEQAEVGRVFERFVQADGTSSRRVGGTGLGLAIVRQLVQHMGGTIELESDLGSGSRFVVRLPLTGVARTEPVLHGRRLAVVGGGADERDALQRMLDAAGASRAQPEDAEALVALDTDGIPTETRVRCVLVGDRSTTPRVGVTRLRPPLLPNELSASLSAATPRPAGRPKPTDAPSLGLKVLLVEDQPINRVIARRYLTRWECEVVEAEDGLLAIAALEAETERPFDVVLMDVQMPNLDGIEATRRIRSAGGPIADLPIIALTANASSEDAGRCLDAGMNVHLTKPVEFDTLRALLKRVAEGRDLTDAA